MVISILQWLFGWLPQANVKQIGNELGRLRPEYRSSSEEENEIEL
jgi:hypothetical protein